MINFKSDGPFRYSNELISVFVITDFPDPVVPAINRCGISAKSATYALPEISCPTANVSGLFALFHSGLSSTDRSVTLAGVMFGNSIPTDRVPGIGASILSLSTAKFSANSLSRAKIFDKFTPAGGRIVYCVTLGPTFADSISTSIPKSPNVDLMMFAFSWIFPALARV